MYFKICTALVTCYLGDKWSEENYTEKNPHKSLMLIKRNTWDEKNYKEEWEKNYTLQLLLATQL